VVSVVPTPDVTQADACAVTSEDHEAGRRSRSSSVRAARESLLLVMLGLLPAVVLVALLGRAPWPELTLAGFAILLLGRIAGGREATRAEQLRGDVSATVALGAVAAVSAVAGVLHLSTARGCVAVAVTCGVCVAGVRLTQPRRAHVRNVVVVGGRAEVEAYVGLALPDQVVTGCLLVDADAASSAQPPFLLPTVTSVDAIDEVVRSTGADDVLVLPGAARPDLVRALSWTLQDARVTFGIVHEVSSVATHRLRTRVSRHQTVLELRAPRATVPVQLAKGLLDRVGAGLLLLLAWPFMLLVWLAVRLDSRGPGLFVQTRVGRDGVPFPMYKFRTMHLDAESLLASLTSANESDGLLFKIQRDPRVTRVGYWLRRSSMDELPQLCNVLRGHMSLVGPRPALPSEVSRYDEVARRRLAVKPGMTGLWQVSGRSDLSWEDSLGLDLYYTDNWRLRDDLAIAARTLSAVVLARGAY
jgi:exopolysaccharide biosynthesis polyprenyl glycosylphosphotransferase